MSVFALNYLSNYDPSDYRPKAIKYPKVVVISFVRYRGFNHPVTLAPLPAGRYYAVPGGGVALKSALEEWALATGTRISYSEEP